MQAISFAQLVEVLKPLHADEPVYESGGYWWYTMPFDEVGPFMSKELATRAYDEYNNFVNDQKDWHLN